jgi:hypothetical protein
VCPWWCRPVASCCVLNAMCHLAITCARLSSREWCGSGTSCLMGGLVVLLVIICGFFFLFFLFSDSTRIWTQHLCSVDRHSTIWAMSPALFLSVETESIPIVQFALSSQSSCLFLLSAWIVEMCHHAWFSFFSFLSLSLSVSLSLSLSLSLFL